MSRRDSGPGSLARTVERLLNTEVRSSRPAAGGCIHQARLLELADGATVFAKGSSESRLEQFETEAAGLEAIAHTGAIRVPTVLAIGDDPPCLILEAIEPGARRSATPVQLGRRLAALHRAPAAARFGFDHSNFLGATPQPNDWELDWVTFFRRQRLGFQLELARSRGLTDPEVDRLGDRLLDRLDDYLSEPAERPSLIHGDLWSGNYLVDSAGLPVLIDPAAYYARREAELGMMVLFGGFPSSLYEAYDEAWPLEPGWRDRVEIYQIYHLLNHLNLFGAGYLGSCRELLRRYA